MSDSLRRRIGRRLLPLLQPTRDEDLRRIEKIAAALNAHGQTLRQQQDEIAALRHELRAAGERVAALRKELQDGLREQLSAAAHEIEVVNRDNLRRLQNSVARSGVFMKGVLRNARHISEHAVTQQHVADRLARIAASGRPIVVGPWTGEVGFELLYWVPFVRWFIEEYAVDPARLIVVSRGGPRSWYGALAGRYVDALDAVSPDRLARPVKTRKQRYVSAVDRSILRHATAGQRMSLLHPSYLYALCGPYFDGFMGTRSLLDMLRPAPIVPPLRSLAPRLPERYIAAKFYFSASFPDTPENRAFVDGLLARISAQMPVVLLQQPSAVDDHRAFESPRHLNLGSVGAAMTPQNNLDVQTAVVGHAQSFVGTYGGFSYLAPLCGVRAFAFHAADEFYEHHRHLADLTFSRLHRPPLVVLPTTASGVVAI